MAVSCYSTRSQLTLCYSLFSDNCRMKCHDVGTGLVTVYLYHRLRGSTTLLGCTEMCCAVMQLRAQALSLRSTECMAGITPPTKPHFRLLQSTPDLKVMLVQCHEVIHNPAWSCNDLNVFPWWHDALCSWWHQAILVSATEV